MAEQFTIPTPGDIIAGKYLIQEELGRGSYGVVFRARQLGVERDVALKTLLPQAFLQTDIVERFQREAALISRLQHPNIVTLYDFGESDGVLYMAMEFIRGRQLSQVIRQDAPVPMGRATHIAVQILQALARAHDKGIVHRDLKPENIILHEHEGDPDFVKVLDFGIAKMTEQDERLGALKTLTIQGYVLGTPHYMAPETITGAPVDNRADLYAVGMLLHEMLSGTHPFDAPNPSAVLMKHLSEPVPALPDPQLERTNVGRSLHVALAKEPDGRFSSAQEFIDAIEGRLRLASNLPPWKTPAGIAALSAAALLAMALGGWAALAWLEPPGAEVEGPDAGAAALEADDAPQAPVASADDAGAAPAQDAALVTADVPEPPEASPDASALANKVTDASPRRPAQEPNTPTTPVPTPPKVETTTLRFSSEPVGAQVIVNGAPVGATPCTRAVQGDRPVQVVFKKIGFRTQAMAVTPRGGSQNVSVKLKPGRIKLTP